MECALCGAGTLGAQWTQDLLSGKRTLVQAAERFNMSVDQVWQHVMEHSSAESQLDVSSKLQKCLRIAEDWLNELIMTHPPDPRTVKQVAALLAEIRRLLALLAELEGSITRPEIQINQYNQLLTVVIEELCPTCQKKLLSYLEEHK